jgi:hypothetical protein
MRRRSSARPSNVTALELECWLKTDESKAVGQHQDGGESVGHESGRRIVTLLRHSDRSAPDEEHMRKVVGYLHRHLAQRPSGDVREIRWRYSRTNWSHDPCR